MHQHVEKRLPNAKHRCRTKHPESNRDNELHDRLTITEKEEGPPSFPKSTRVERHSKTLVFRAGRRRERIFNSRWPAPIYFAVGKLAIATGRASRSLRPAVERHHRSSRALTQDAPTLRDLLIFEIARLGMFIWRRGCRRESPVPSLSPPGLALSFPLPICRLTFLNSFRRARAPRGAPFFASYVSVPRTPPFFPLQPSRLVAATTTTAFVVGWSANWEKRGNAPERTRPYWSWCILRQLYHRIVTRNVPDLCISAACIFHYLIDGYAWF